jgi:aspartate kinase
MRVLKFGGTSVADAAAISRLVAIVCSQRQAVLSQRGVGPDSGAPDRPPGPFVVVSALSGVTDTLLRIGRMAVSDDAATIADLEYLDARHREVADVVGDPRRRTTLLDQIAAEMTALDALVRDIRSAGAAPPASLDALVAIGEILSSRVVAAALEDAGLPTIWFDPRNLLITDDEHGRAMPMLPLTFERLQALVGPALLAGDVPVTGGFVGATPHGLTTTLGRGGSDYSAAIIGAGLGATEIQIWTDVDGMLTADPRLVSDVQLVPHLSFAEASELAYFGAKVLHPSTIQPALERAIPVRILNSRRPQAAGTLITATRPPSPRPVTALACKRAITVIDITSTRMLMAYGFLRRLFEVFERLKVPVDVVTTSEVSVSVTIDDRRRLAPLLAELSTFAEVSCDHEMAVLCVVGESLRGEAALVLQVIGALEGIALRMVSQAASRRNITVVLREADAATAMNRLHARFFGESAATTDALLVGDAEAASS